MMIRKPIYDSIEAARESAATALSDAHPRATVRNRRKVAVTSADSIENAKSRLAELLEQANDL